MQKIADYIFDLSPKKLAVYLILGPLVLFLCSCDNNPKSKLFSQNFEKSKAKNELEVISLDSVMSFSELREMMGKIACKRKVSGLKFEDNDTIYHILGFSSCPTSSEIACYFRRNLLTIKNDSLIIGRGKEKNKKPIKYLKTELENIISKPYNFQHNKDKLKPALIYLYIEDKHTISITKKVLKEIAKQFQNINPVHKPDFFNYTILFKGFDITNVPPPPPPIPPPPIKPNEIELEE
ncbi:hypothetical protein D1816_18545 [Aquimarina sp. AD10]|uniref:hypothetical protein n=1 Tax=Aquimarina sp. AD10 TaxID=1714849 RepID=UPI000E4AC97A|nr:hypothetical protein [Aquimarina sp. AD10]AXT62277.1 hypothetical protein D1816_18545 [Aquimarina sp. AD10]RKM90528.1 hypothetical protein D7033_23835 [Aquimarina sp. AD10]